MREAHAPLLDPVEGHAVEALEGRLAAAGEQQVGEVAVEEDGLRGKEVAQQRQAGRELVDDEGAGLQRAQFTGDGDVDDEVDVAEDGAEDGEAGENRHGDEPVAADSDFEGA